MIILKQGQDFCSILVLTPEGTGTGAPNAQCGSQLENQRCMDASVNCQKSAKLERETSKSFNSSPPVAPIDIEKGASDFPKKINQETTGSIKTEMASMKLLRRQNSLQTGPESIPPLVNHILMLLKFDPKEKQAIERAHDAARNKWRKYKRAASFDSRQIVLLFSILSSMGTIVLIFLTLRVRQVSDGYIHG